MGIVTRLAQTSKPENYPANFREWVDLHTSNVLSIDNSLTGTAFWAALQLDASAAYNRYARGEMFWAMNSKTYAKLKAKAIATDINGAFVAMVGGTLPIVSGDIDILEFMPDGRTVKVSTYSPLFGISPSTRHLAHRTGKLDQFDFKL